MSQELGDGTAQAAGGALLTDIQMGLLWCGILALLYSYFQQQKQPGGGGGGGGSTTAGGGGAAAAAPAPSTAKPMTADEVTATTPCTVDHRRTVAAVMSLR